MLLTGVSCCCSDALTPTDMYKMGMRVTGQTGQAKLKVSLSGNHGFMQDQIIASHTCFGGHMDINC